MEVDEKNSSSSDGDGGSASVASSLTSVKFQALARQAIQSIKSEATSALAEARETSTFASWTSNELRSLLAEHGVEIRGGDSAPRETLVRICEAVFSKDSDLSPPIFTKEDPEKVEDAARLIQQTYLASRKGEGGGNAVAISVSIPLHDGGREDEDERDYDIHENEDYDNDNDEDDNELNVAWRRPSYRYAKRLDISSRPNRDGKPLDWRRITLGRHCTMTGCGEQLDLWDEGVTSELSQFGSGITNYFKFLKWCCWVMTVLSILHLPILIINLMGGSLQYEANNAASTTFGNLGGSDEVFVVRLPFCDVGNFVTEDSCLISKDRLAVGIAWLDAVSTIFVICAWLWLRRFQAIETLTLDRSTVSASDYTLCVRGIPPDAKEDDLMEHFQRVAGGEPVADVHLAFANSKEISLYFHRGKLVKRRYDVVQRIRYELTRKRLFQEGTSNGNGTSSTSHSDLWHKPPTNPQRTEKRLAKLHAERTKLTAQIRLADEKRQGIMAKDGDQSKAIQAFVTYQTESALIRAIAAYQLTWVQSLGLCCCYPKHLRLKGRRLAISQAPEPSTIIWENLEYSNLSRFLRQGLTGIVAMLVICISIACTFRARDFQAKTLEATSLPCPDGFYSLDADQQRDIIEQNTELAHCYCSTLRISEQVGIGLCSDYLSMVLRSSATNYAASFLVVGINMAFTIIFDWFGSFERHASIEHASTSNLIRVFLLKVVNTGALVILYGQTWLQRLFLVRLEDSSPEWDVEWYATGGVSLIIVMCMNVVTPHLFPVIRYLRHRSKVRRLEKHLNENKDIKTFPKTFYSQEELNDYVGSNATFCLNYRISQTLVTFYICFVYALSMPVLLFIGALSFFLSYWVDKWLFCRFYRTPPVYSDRMGKTASKLLGCSIVLHLIMSMWSLGTNDKIFDGLDAFVNGSNLSNINVGALTSLIQRIILQKRHLVILETVLLIFFGCLIASRLASRLGGGLLGLCRCIACQATKNKAKKMETRRNTVDVDYRSACQRGIIKGLASFNILKNSRYAEAFGITAEFAESHKRVCSIRGLNVKEGGGMV